MSLESVTDQIKTRVTEKGGIDGKIIKFDLGDGVVRIDGTASPASVDNEDGEADCTVKVSMEDFTQILDGAQDPQMAFMMGKLSVDGDMSIAMQLGTVLG